MKKIVIFSKNLCIGGMEKALVTLINQIDKSKYEVTLVLEEKKGDLCDKLDERVKVIDYKLSTQHNMLIRKTINLFKKIKFIIKNYNKYDCSIDYATYSVFCSQLSRKICKNNIIFIHSDYYNMYDGNIIKIKDFFATIDLEKFKKIIFISKASKDKIIKIMPNLNEKSTLLGNFIDYNNILQKSTEYKVEMDKNKTNIVFVGRLDEKAKKISRLIDAVNNNKETEKFNLYIIGSGSDEQLYKKMVKSKNIVFIGEKKNPYPYIKTCEYLILTSKYEGFPVVYSEATILNTKIITTIPAEDEILKFTEERIIKLDQQLSNFDEVIKSITTEKQPIKVEQIDYKTINETKLKKLYSIIEK